VRTRANFLLVSTPALILSACATPARMHSDAQLNNVALGCGLALGELIQDESEKRVLISMRIHPSPAQRLCVARWARANHLHAMFIDSVSFPAG
jgi:hypothetical protein